MTHLTCSEKVSAKNGSILLTILIVMFILSMTLGSLLTLTSQYFYSTQDKIDSEQAFYLAEAGLEAATIYVVDQGSLLPSSHSDSGTVGNGTFSYVITKNGFDKCDIVSTGEVNGKKRAVTLIGVRSSTYAKFAFWAKDNGSIYFKDGETFFGHIHTDSKPWFSGDPEFNGVFTTKANGYEGSISDVEFKKGFKTNTDMGSMADVDFSALKTFAEDYPSEALLLTGETSIEFNGTQMLITNADKEWEKEPVAMSSEQMVYIQEGTVTSMKPNGYKYVGDYKGDYRKKDGKYYYVGFGTYKGRYIEKFEEVTETSPGALSIDGGTLDGRVTIVTEEDIYINDHIEYSINPLDEDAVATAIADAKAEAEANGEKFDKNAVVNDALGLISGDDVIISGSAPDDITIQATIMATGAKSSSEGSFYVDNYSSYDPRGFINLLGGIVQEERGPVGSFSTKTGKTSSSYDKNYVFDTRFESTPPPYFPPLQSGLTYELWQETTPN
ncbi:type II secretion system protein [Pontiellaceae bacterium B1224]|nr:type II secretion system protein [Pontiellaceae bacterium B1224]